MKTVYNYEHGDEVLVYWGYDGQGPEKARVMEFDSVFGLKLTLGDTGRVYKFDLDKAEAAKTTDVFRDASGRLVRIANRNKDRKNPKPTVDIG